MGRIGDKRTEAEVQADLETSRALRMKNASALLFDLADAGFTHLWMEITQVTSHGNFLAQVFVNDNGVDAKRFAVAMEIAAAHGAKPYMDELRINQDTFSRLAFWPAGEE